MIRDNGWPCAISKELGKFRRPGRKEDPCPYANLAMLKLLVQTTVWRDSQASHSRVEALLTLWSESTQRHPYMFFMGTDFRNSRPHWSGMTSSEQRRRNRSPLQSAIIIQPIGGCRFQSLVVAHTHDVAPLIDSLVAPRQREQVPQLVEQAYLKEDHLGELAREGGIISRDHYLVVRLYISRTSPAEVGEQ